MIQSFGTLESQVELLKSILKRSNGAFIQKIFNTPTMFCLRLRIPGQNLFLYIGKGRGVEGLWISEEPPVSDIRIKDKFSDWLYHNLRGKKVIEIEIDGSYRILKLNLFSNLEESTFAIFYKGRRMYFSSFFSGKKKIFQSWIGRNQEVKLKSSEISIAELFNGIYGGPKEKKGNLFLSSLGSHLDGLIQTKPDKRKQKNILKKIQETERKLISVEKAKELQPKISTMENTKIVESFEALGLKIKTKREEGPYQFKDRSFKKIKNFKNSKTFLEKKLEGLREELEKASDSKKLKKTTFPEWGEVKSKKKDHNIKTFKMENLVGGLGLNIKGNDHLRNKFGKKEDSWFHLEGDKSCHVVIKTPLSSLSPKNLELIGSLIRDHMGLSFLEINLIAAELRNIKGLKGSSGSVLVKKSKTYKVTYRTDWREIISFD